MDVHHREDQQLGQNRASRLPACEPSLRRGLGFETLSNREIDWHNVEEEFNEFAIKQLDEIGSILFGRITYENMASYWPDATEDDPAVAEQMNSLPKVVVSKTLETADWNNTRLIRENAVEAVAELKLKSGSNLAIFGNSDLSVSLLEVGLVNELRVMVSPVLLGDGKPLFSGLAEDFYTDALGLVVRTDEESGQEWRYLTVAPDEDAETVLQLVEADGPEQEDLVGKQAAGRPLVMFASDDIQDDYWTMRDRGVVFHGEPWSVPGGHGVRFEDLDGNQFDLYQPSSTTKQSP